MSYKIVIIDYALGNTFNVQRAFEHEGAKATISKDPAVINQADKIVLPGVGAFGEGMKHLRESGLDQLICESAGKGKPVLGICLGMQLLMSESEEHGKFEGLNLIAGQVLHFDRPKSVKEFKLPQICWNQIHIPAALSSWDNTILAGVSLNTEMYFVHSYRVQPEDKAVTVAETSYGYNTYTSVVQKDNVMGCQFHPERSGVEGLKIINNFINM